MEPRKVATVVSVRKNSSGTKKGGDSGSKKEKSSGIIIGGSSGSKKGGSSGGKKGGSSGSKKVVAVETVNLSLKQKRRLASMLANLSLQ